MITLSDDILSATAKRAVRYTFNPSNLDTVNRLKLLGAALITECEKLRAEGGHLPEQARAASVAITHVEDAVMWAVKAATSGQP